jgi:hypothetical protein
MLAITGFADTTRFEPPTALTKRRKCGTIGVEFAIPSKKVRDYYVMQ